MQQETSIERFKRRIKTRRYRVWLGKRILVIGLASMFIASFVVIPVMCSSENSGNASAQASETPAITEAAPPETVPDENTVMIYDVPLGIELQLFIIHECEGYHIDPAIVLAMIYRESRFQDDAIGDNGNSYGLMQIQPRWHQERMRNLGVTDLLDPFQNVKVGVNFLSELIEYCNGDIECALMCYNAGIGGANKNWFSSGVYTNEYSQGVLEKADEIREGMTAHDLLD